jgi:hypothetical protein
MHGFRCSQLEKNVEVHYPHHHIRLQEIPGDHNGRWLPHLTGAESVVTTIRNPFDILVSYWLERGKRNDPPKTFAEWIYRFAHEGWDRWGPIMFDGRLSYHMPGCDTILRYERLTEDWQELLRRFDITGPDTLKPTGPICRDKKQPFQQYYDEEAVQAAYECFAEDFKATGYTFDGK